MPIADTIANLILQSGQNQAELAQRRGDIAAQAAARSGQIWQQGFATLADVLNPAKIQAMRDQAAESAQAREMNQLKLDAAKTAQARGAALSKIQQQYGSASPDVMLKALRDQGFTSEATQLEGDLLDLGKKRIDAETADIKNTQEVTQRVIPQVMNITDQASQDAFLQGLPQTLQGHDDVQQFVAQALGPTFDPQRVQVLAQTGQSFSQIMGARADAAQKLAADASRAKSLADMSRSMFEAGTSVMASSTTPQAWATNREYVVKQFPELERVIPQEFSPEAAAQMRSLAIGPAKEAELAGQAATRAQTKNYQDRMAGAAEARAAAAASGPKLSPAAESNIINRLTTQWGTASKSGTEIDRQVQLMDAGMEAARRGDMAPGSQAVLVTFQKILDPDSVVRESEYARSASGQSALARAQGFVDRVTKGGAGVPLAELEKFATLAREMAKAGSEHRNALKERIGKTADRYGIPRDVVFEDYALPGAAPSAAPAAAPAATPQRADPLGIR